MSKLYVVATPLGNKGDFTDRAREVLATADYVFAEDTRMLKQLLNLYGIKLHGKSVSYHAKSAKGKEAQILEILKNENVTAALVTDAGTPAISDPGAELVRSIREQIPECAIVPVPGPSAITALLSVAGLPDHRFAFWGFVPQKKGRQTFLQNLAAADIPVVFYESPHRIMKTLSALVLLVPNKQLCIGREMTKHFEEYPSGTVSSIFEYYQAHPEKVKGEFSCVIF